MAEPTPIREGIEPEFDTEREVADYLLMRLRRYREETGRPPQGIAVVMLGDNDKGQFVTLAHSWSPGEDKSRFEICSMAATLLTTRASKSD